MDLYQHHRPDAFELIVRGTLAENDVQELEHAWTTARSILGTKTMTVEVPGLTEACLPGIELLSRMRASGARVTVAPPLESTGKPGLPGISAAVRFTCALRKVVDRHSSR